MAHRYHMARQGRTYRSNMYVRPIKTAGNCRHMSTVENNASKGRIRESVLSEHSKRQLYAV